MIALNKKIFGMLLTSWTLAGTIAVPASQAQLVPAPDGTWTFTRTSNRDPNQINILGGTQSGSNLFHSFRQFSLQQNQIANFAVNPGVVNILTRVTGGDASIINGTLRVSGSPANLFLMNPAGILFGPNAQLNLPAAFTATTANAIGVGGLWFNANGANSYEKLTGTPNSFAFLSNPGSIFNAGNLITNPGQSLTLLGGTVINTGTIVAPDGNVTIAAVPGENQVTISQEGSLLSLRLPTESRAAINAPIATPLSLPALLTGRGAVEATGIVVENGTVRLVGSGMDVQNGDVAVKGFVSGGTTTLFGNRNLTLAESQIQSTGNLTLLAGDTVQIRDSAQTPFSILSVGDLKIQGDRGINILATNHFKNPLQSGGRTSLISDGKLSTDASFASNGAFSVLNRAGGVGNFKSLQGTTITSNSDVIFGNYTGGSLWIQNAGGIQGGDISITAANPNLIPLPIKIVANPDLTPRPTLILRAKISKNSNLLGFRTENQVTSALNSIVIRNIDVGGGAVEIINNGDIDTGSIYSGGGSILIKSQQKEDDSLDTTTIQGTSGGSIKIRGNIKFRPRFQFDSRMSSITDIVQLFAPGDITIQDIDTANENYSSGSIKIKAAGNISTASINTLSSQNDPKISGNGNIEITSLSNINTTRGTLKAGRIILITCVDFPCFTGGKIKTASLESANNDLGIRLFSASDISTDSILSSDRIMLSSFNGSITSTGAIRTSANDLIGVGSKGVLYPESIVLRARGDIRTSNVIAETGDIALSSVSSINTQNGTLTLAGSPSPQRYIKLEGGGTISTGNLVINGGKIRQINQIPPPLSSSDFPGDGGLGQSPIPLPGSPQFALARLLPNPNNLSVGSEDSASSTTGEPSIENNKVNLTPQDSPLRVNNKCESFGWDLQTDEIIKGNIIPSYENKLTKPQQQRDNFQIQLDYYNLGVAHFKLGNYKKAIDNFEKSRELATGADKVNNQQPKGRILTNLGATYNVLGDYPKAIKLQEDSLKALKSSCDAKHTDNQQAQALSLRNAGIAYLSQEKPDLKEAEKKQNEARELSQKSGDTIGEARSLGNLGEIYLMQGKYQDAIAHATQELEISKKLNHLDGQRHAFNLLGWANYWLGWANNSRQQYREAIKYQQEYLRISKQLQDPIGQGQALNNLGDAHSRLGEFSEAEMKLEQAIQIWQSLQAKIDSNDIHKVSFFETQALTYTTLQEVLVAQGKSTEALEIAEKGRSRSLVEILARKSQSSLDAPSIADIQRIARDRNATLVEYSIVRNGFNSEAGLQVKDSKLQIWVVSPSGQVKFKEVSLMAPEWKNESLSQKIKSSRELIGTGGRGSFQIQQNQTPSNPSDRLKELHKLLIEPIADFLPTDPNAHVIFVPHGELFLVPFPALQDAKGTYLLEKHTILTAPAIQVLDLTRKKRQQVDQAGLTAALVVGNPTMPQLTKLGGKPEKLIQLPHAEREANRISDLLKTRAWTGTQATKAAIVLKLSQARIIHLATHGFLDDLKGLGTPGAIALAPDGTGEPNDGLLTANEILDLKLNAELVVLSACDTGGGKITSDSVIGLSRSLIIAGASSVMVSLWSVPDAPTAELMTEFYKNWKERKLDKAQALRQAMLTIMKRPNAQPKDWAAFTLIGESN